jgi:hypothetical protein
MSLFKGFDAKQAVLIDFDITGLADPVSRIDELETILNHTLGPFGESDVMSWVVAKAESFYTALMRRRCSQESKAC